jgi:hypothetical protein
MPYINDSDRLKFNRVLEILSESADINNDGELNYFITKILHKYIEKKGTSYQSFNDCMGVLEGAKLELYRRKVSEYEDIKINENGDV